MILYIIETAAAPRIYVGTTTQRLSRRWAEHRSSARAGSNFPIHRAMRKYGLEAFSIREIERAESWEDLCAKEAALIASLPKARRYNVATGGQGRPGCTVSIKTREKIRKAHLGKKLSAEHRLKLSEAKRGKTLPPRSEQHSARISAGLVRAHARRRQS